MAIVKKKEEALVAPPTWEADVPDFLKETDGARGLDTMDSKDVIVPRLSICQSMSPQRKKSDPKFIAGLEEGQLFNSVTGQIYGTETVVTPIVAWKSRILFNPLDEGGGIRCTSVNAIDGGEITPEGCSLCLHSQWKGHEQPDCNLLYNYLVVLHPTEEMIVVSMKGSAIKPAKLFNSLMRARRKDIFAGKYSLKTIEQKGKKGDFFNWVPDNAGWVSADQYLRFTKMWDMFKDDYVKLRVDIGAEITDDPDEFNSASAEY